MPMMAWNAHRQQVVAGVGGLAKLSPDMVRGYAAGNEEAYGRNAGSKRHYNTASRSQ